MSLLFLDDIDVSGKRVVVRVDYNVPVKDGSVTDDTRIRGSLETVNHILDAGGACVLCSHRGKPKGERKEDLTLAPAAERLGELIGREVRMAPDCVGDEVARMAADLDMGQVLMLENLRFHKGEEAGEDDFARQLAALGDVYCVDAFGTAHRAHASMVGALAHAKACCGGFLIKAEHEYLSKALENPERPYMAISGGAKVSSKMGVIQNLLEKVDEMIIGGAMANTFLAARGHKVGASLMEEDMLEDAAKIMVQAEAKNIPVHLPVDVVYGSGPKASEAAGVCTVDELPQDMMILDIGPKTVALFAEMAGRCKTVMWNGPMGAFENKAFAAGTVDLARKVADIQATTIVGGGDTDAAIHQAGVIDKFDFISTGGGSFLEFLEGKDLPAFKALRECSK
jgi:phosphoglycerate kinase